MDASAREDLRSYVAGRSAALLRTASLLTGHRADAEDLLRTALAKTYLAWDRIRDREAVDGDVCRVMVDTQTSWSRRRKVDERPSDELPDRGGGRDGTADLDLHDALWTALTARNWRPTRPATACWPSTATATRTGRSTAAPWTSCRPRPRPDRPLGRR